MVVMTFPVFILPVQLCPFSHGSNTAFPEKELNLARLNVVNSKLHIVEERTSETENVPDEPLKLIHKKK